VVLLEDVRVILPTGEHDALLAGAVVVPAAIIKERSHE
jgi:hypothetical protein